MGIFSFVGRQAQHPSGFWGKLVVRFMTRMTADQSRWTVEMLDVQPDHAALEVGFGAGVGIHALANRATNGSVVGVEISEAMVEVASKKNASAIEDGRVELILNEGSRLPFEDGRFDRACTINTVYVMESPGVVFKEIFRVLKPSGKAAIAFPVRENFAKFRPARTPGMHLHELSDLRQSFEDAGFENVKHEVNEDVKFGLNCLTGTKPGPA